jgi:hypothetical protein
MNARQLILSILVAMVLMVRTAPAKDFILFGEPLSVAGYISNELVFSPNARDHYDTVKGIQSDLMNLFVEGKYSPLKDLQFYASSKMTVDWAYQLNANRGEWNDKLFSKSRGHLNVDDKYWQILNEAHVTWSPGGKSLIRVGKQIVGWGQTDMFRLMDQINPLDQRRGFADVQFEDTIIPIWLVRAEYYQPIMTKWLQEIGVQFVFNPNADFIRNQEIQLGNDVGGIWAPNAKINLGGPFPLDYAHLGSAYQNIKEPQRFNYKGYEYGLKVEAMIYDAVVTLNGYYGRDKDPEMIMSPIAPLTSVASDKRLLLNLFFEGFYPCFQFVGGTFTRDVPFLRIPIGGSPSPVVRLEGLYAFNTTFVTSNNTFEKHDELRWAIGVDWKLYIRFLNPKAGISIMPQFYQRTIMDFPHGYGLTYASAGVEKNNYMATLVMSTSYLNARLTPMVAWAHDITNHADFFKLQLGYAYTDNWRFTLGAILFYEEEKNKNTSFALFKNKDQVFLKAEYRWN